MRLSEAIRLGSMMHPQAFGLLFDRVGTCAWGAAYVAVGAVPRWTQEQRADHHSVLEPEEVIMIRNKKLKHGWGWTNDNIASCPACHATSSNIPVVHQDASISAIIITLNDLHGWTREAVADWVEQQEERYLNLAPIQQEEVNCEVQ